MGMPEKTFYCGLAPAVRTFWNSIFGQLAVPVFSQTSLQRTSLRYMRQKYQRNLDIQGFPSPAWEF
jgi:hypothetical protein